jgi:hypothetical protein
VYWYKKIGAGATYRDRFRGKYMFVYTQVIAKKMTGNRKQHSMHFPFFAAIWPDYGEFPFFLLF